MKLLQAALAVTFAVAVTASVFAIWPAVADAPWEDDAPPPVVQPVNRSQEMRCQAALDLRERVLFDSEPSNDAAREAWVKLYREAESEIEVYC